MENKENNKAKASENGDTVKLANLNTVVSLMVFANEFTFSWHEIEKKLLPILKKRLTLE